MIPLFIRLISVAAGGVCLTLGGRIVVEELRGNGIGFWSALPFIAIEVVVSGVLFALAFTS